MRTVTLVAVVLALTLAGCSSDDTSTTTTTTTNATTEPPVDHTPKVYNVTMSGSKFVDAALTIKTGDTVHWIHADANTPHTVTADDGSFDSRPNCVAGVPVSQVCMVNGDAFDQTFAKAGTVAYHCKVHPAMKGTITVTEHAS